MGVLDTAENRGRLLAASGVRVSHSPLVASTVPIDKFALSHILELVLGCVQYTESEAARRAAFFFSPCAIGLRSYRTRCCWIPSMLPILAKLGSGARSAYERAGFRAVARLSRDSRRVEILPCRAANSSALDSQLGAAPLPLPAARRSGSVAISE